MHQPQPIQLMHHQLWSGEGGQHVDESNTKRNKQQKKHFSNLSNRHDDFNSELVEEDENAHFPSRGHQTKKYATNKYQSGGESPRGSADQPIRSRQLDLKLHLDEQVADLKQKAQVDKDLRKSEAVDVRDRAFELDLVDAYKTDEKRRLAQECDWYNRETHRLKLEENAKAVKNDMKYHQDLVGAMRETELKQADEQHRIKGVRHEELHLLRMQANDDSMRRNEHKVNKSNYDNQVIEIHDLNERSKSANGKRLSSAKPMESARSVALDDDQVSAIAKREDKSRDFY